MPTYEYACDACGNHWELEQRISEDPVKKCPACGKPRARRMISQGNFVLKGGGWYADLYSGPSNKKGTSSSGTGGGGSKSGPPAEKKPSSTESKAPPSSGSKPPSS